MANWLSNGTGLQLPSFFREAGDILAATDMVDSFLRLNLGDDAKERVSLINATYQIPLMIAFS